MSFFEELKRRNVVRVGVAYLITAWLLLQIADVFIDNIGAPDWLFAGITLMLGIGFPVVLIFSWVFELTPDGIRREQDVDRSQSIATQTGRKLDRAIIAVLVLAVAYFIWESRYAERAPATAEPEQIAASESTPAPESMEPSIAVLPFSDLSPDKDQEYFSDGIAEELLNLLVRVDGLKVASRTSSFTYKGSTLNLAEIADELKVDHILEGSVRKADNRVRITAQLIDAETDRHLWSDTYDRELEDIFGIQDDIANAIVDALRQELGVSGDGKAVTVEAATDNLDAYEVFLEGRSLFVARRDLPRAVALLERAVELDPQFDRAWAELAATYAVMESWGYREQPYFDMAVQAADRALELNPRLSTPWAVKGQSSIEQYDPVSGIQFLDQAIEVDPGNATNYLWRGINLSNLGFHSKSIDDFNRCLDIDPAYENCRRHLAISHMLQGNNEQAIELFQQGTEAGFQGSSGVFAQRFISLGNRLMGAQAVLAGEPQVSTLPVKEILDAMQFPDREHSRGLAKFRAWANSAGRADGQDSGVFAVFKAWDLVDPFTFGNRWIWLEENRDFRKTPQFKSFADKAGMLAYWQEKGFPSACRAVGEEGFECE